MALKPVTFLVPIFSNGRGEANSVVLSKGIGETPTMFIVGKVREVGLETREGEVVVVTVVQKSTLKEGVGVVGLWHHLPPSLSSVLCGRKGGCTTSADFNPFPLSPFTPFPISLSPAEIVHPLPVPSLLPSPHPSIHIHFTWYIEQAGRSQALEMRVQRSFQMFVVVIWPLSSMWGGRGCPFWFLQDWCEGQRSVWLQV